MSAAKSHDLVTVVKEVHNPVMFRFSPQPNRAQLIPWQEWSDDAFRAARAEDKPVMLFLGAFWCRYCQRMDEEAFSETENIALLNAYFISLRVENAQRPDVDARYNLNGWPTLAFVTPAGELLAAANFMPAEEFKELLLNVYLGYQAKPVTERLRPAIVEPQSDSAPPREINAARALTEITDAVMALADRVHGGYDRGQKFIHPQVNDFLLDRYEATNDRRYLDQVCLTLQRMRAGELCDQEGGAYFRTSSNSDWSHPHREKLLLEEAGLLANCLSVFRLTKRAEFQRMAEEIIQYLNGKLFDPARGAFFGCEDWLRHESPAAGAGEFFTIIDRCIYTDANAVTSAAYLEAALLLGKPQYRERALKTLEFLWQNCCTDGRGMFHYFDGAGHVPGLLLDQAQMGLALLRAHEATRDAMCLERARRLAEFVITQLKNPAGGFYDIGAEELAALVLRLTLIEQNGAAASFFLRLAAATRDEKYRDAAGWALCSFTADFAQYGVHAAPFGRALGELLSITTG
ncbi:MAG: thioredoxin domain-containing protein [Deltaproteobacteria bacterium]|nr:thioredoxin domain-containing protein [Deltaproteobacteria bacterium]